MKKIILNWLFGTDNVKDYIELLLESKNHNVESIQLIQDHLKTLYEEQENLKTMRKLIRICENHGIDVDEEIKKV